MAVFFVKWWWCWRGGGEVAAFFLRQDIRFSLLLVPLFSLTWRLATHAVNREFDGLCDKRVIPRYKEGVLTAAASRVFGHTPVSGELVSQDVHVFCVCIVIMVFSW